MTHTAEPMSLETVRDFHRKLATEHKVIPPLSDAHAAMADAIDAELAKLDNLEDAIFQIAVRLGVERESEMDDMDYHTDLIARAQFLSELAKQREAEPVVKPSYWAAIEIEDGELAIAYSADDANDGEVARTKCNQWINDQPHLGEYRLTALYTRPQQRNAVEVTDKLFEQECIDIDTIISKLGLTVEQARTEGGALRVARICNHIQETLDALVQATNFSASMSDKYCALSAASRDREDAELTDDEADHLVARVMDSIAAKRAMHALDLSPDITMHHELRREIVRAARRENKP